jgi:septal ring factor EnvC (AmiA/AmiB activator)
MHQALATHEKRGQAGALLLGILLCAILLILAFVFGAKNHKLKGQLTDTQKQLSQSKAEASQAEGALGADKAQVADLQTQLAKVQKQAADLQTQLDKANDTSAQQQAQLDRDKAQAADFQSELGKAQAEAADWQAQLTQATSGSRQLLTQLDQANIQALDLRSRLEKAESELAQLQPLLLKARHLPVTTSLEPTQGGSSFTLHVANLSPQPLSVEITRTGPGSPGPRSHIIGAGATFNLEHLSAGENVVIASEGYDPVSLAVQ